MRHNYNWENEFNYQGFETKQNNETLFNEALEALNRFYQKENKRNKTAKQKKHCWQ